MLDAIRAKIEAARFDAHSIPYGVALEYMPAELVPEFLELNDKMEAMPDGYSGTGNYGIEGELKDKEKITWDRYSELYQIATLRAKENGYTTVDPASTTLIGSLKLRLLAAMDKSPRDLHL